MSTVSGLYPNAITPTVSPYGDLAQRAQQRRDNDAAVFAPVEETQAMAPGRNRSGQRDGQTALASASATATGTPSPQPEGQGQAPDEVPSADDTSAFARQRDESRAASEQAEQRQLEQDLEAIRELAARDREVRAHEQAHQAVGGQYAGGMSLTFERGPDGKRYAVAGEVPIDISPVPGNPEATLAKAEQVRRAALAPAEPSAQDRSVAAAAMQLKMEAQIEVRQERRDDLAPQADEAGENAPAEDSDSIPVVAGAERPDLDERASDDAPQRDANNKQSGPEPTSSDLAEVTRNLLDAQYQAQSRADVLGRQLDFMV